MAAPLQAADGPGGARVIEAWSLAEPLPERTQVVDQDVLEGGLVLRRIVVDREGAEQLVRNLREGRAALLDRPAGEIARALGRVGQRFLEDTDPLREEALRLLPSSAAVSPAMAREILNGMASDWTERRLWELLERELAGGAVLDGFTSEALAGRRVRALGPAFTVHVCSGTVPGVSVTSLVRALLVKSSVLLKPGRGDEVLPRLFRQGLVETAPELAAAAGVVYWPGGAGEPLERFALEGADLLVVYGDQETIREVRGSARATTPVVAYPHRVSFAVVGAEGGEGVVTEAAWDAARAVALFEQRGCVSPHLVYVLGAEEDASAFADALASSLARASVELPAPPAGDLLAARLHQERGAAEVAQAAGRGRAWSGSDGSWTVVLDPSLEFRASCLGRFVWVKPASSIESLLEAVRPYRRHLQTVAVAGLEGSLPELAEGLARMGAVRIAPLPRAPWPPAWWHHDGQGALAALVRWTDLEEGSQPS